MTGSDSADDSADNLKLVRRPGEFHHVIRATADVTDSRRNSLFTFVSTVTEKLENRNKFERRGKSYL